jgi:signal transduction histidine kinase
MDEQLRRAGNAQENDALACGVVHDVNNLLTAIAACAGAMKRRGQADSDTFADLERIESAAMRASELTRRLLVGARRKKPRVEPVDMHDVVAEVLSILEHVIDKRIRVEAQCGASRTLVLGDPGQLSQVVLNLAVNASDAMPHGGQLTVRTRVAQIGAGEQAQKLKVASGPYVVVEVADSGLGVPKEVRGRIFEPFFTTKPPGKGTGVGLAVACNIARNHGGTITVDSAPGQGTTFFVFLPATE